MVNASVTLLVPQAGDGTLDRGSLSQARLDGTCVRAETFSWWRSNAEAFPFLRRHSAFCVLLVVSRLFLRLRIYPPPFVCLCVSVVVIGEEDDDIEIVT